MWICVLVALLAGILMPLQAAINSELAKWLQHPLQASFISFLLGTFCLLLVLASLRVSPFDLPTKGPIPLYLFLGGILGAFFVTAAMFLVSRLGAVTMTALFISGQLVAGALMDHWGLLGVPHRPLGFARVLGILFLTGGVLLLKKGT